MSSSELMSNVQALPYDIKELVYHKLQTQQTKEWIDFFIHLVENQKQLKSFEYVVETIHYIDEHTHSSANIYAEYDAVDLIISYANSSIKPYWIQYVIYIIYILYLLIIWIIYISEQLVVLIAFHLKISSINTPMIVNFKVMSINFLYILMD